MVNTRNFVVSRWMRWKGYVAHMGKTNEYRGLEGIPEGIRPLGRPTHK